MPTIPLTKRLIHTGSLVLVNREHSIIEEPDWTMLPVDEANSIFMAQRPAAALTQLIKDIDAQGKIVPVSGFRSKNEQGELITGVIRDKGAEFASKYVATPGCSEHQTGLAVDLAQHAATIDSLCPEFPYTGICGKFRVKAADYGFIERYPKGKEGITGFAHEPWHFRYVGYPHSAIIQEEGLALEEYIIMLKKYPYPHKVLEYCNKGATIKTGFAAQGIIQIPHELWQLSGNNVDGVIVTVWK